MNTLESPSPTIPLHVGPGESGLEPDSPQLLADPVAYFTSGYRTHGPIFRTRYRGTDWVTIAGIEANDFFWQNTSDWSYEQAGQGFRDQFGPQYLTQLDGAPHLRKRRLLKPAFSAEAVGKYVPVMARVAERFLVDRDQWSDDANEWVPALLLSLNKATLLQTEMSQDMMRAAEYAACARRGAPGQHPGDDATTTASAPNGTASPAARRMRASHARTHRLRHACSLRCRSEIAPRAPAAAQPACSALLAARPPPPRHCVPQHPSRARRISPAAPCKRGWRSAAHSGRRALPSKRQQQRGLCPAPQRARHTPRVRVNRVMFASSRASRASSGFCACPARVRR